MIVNREELLKVLESVSPGLASREIIEQSSCLVFSEGKVITFNDEVACTRESPLKIKGAVNAAPLLALLRNMPEDNINITQSKTGLLVEGKRRKAKITMDADVKLPIEAIDIPDDWLKLNSDFNEAIALVQNCASADASNFVITCIHIHPDFIEACNKFQLGRYEIKTGLEESILVRADSLKRIVGFDMTKYSVTNSWIHFKNPAGLVFSCRKFSSEDPFPELDKFLESDGLDSISLPPGLEEIVLKAEIFSSDNTDGDQVLVDLSNNKISIKGIGAYGWYKEIKTIDYQGHAIKFYISPNLLIEISKKSNKCKIDDTRLFVNTGKFMYAASTHSVKDPAKE